MTARVRAADDLFVMIDTSFSAEITDHVDDPVAASAGAVSVLYCLRISLHRGDSPSADSGDGAGAGLGALWGYQRAEAMLRAAGFTDVDRYRAPRPQNAVCVASGWSSNLVKPKLTCTMRQAILDA
jgi:hypothetical protein